MKPLKIVLTSSLCLALFGCGSGDDSSIRVSESPVAGSEPSVSGDTSADSVPSLGGEGSADTAAVAGLWLNVVGLDEGEPPGYLEIFADGQYINWEGGDTEDCLFKLGPFPIKNMGSDDYAVPEETLNIVNEGDQISLTDSQGTSQLPAATNLKSSDFSICEGTWGFSADG